MAEDGAAMKNYQNEKPLHSRRKTKPAMNDYQIDLRSPNEADLGERRTLSQKPRHYETLTVNLKRTFNGGVIDL